MILPYYRFKNKTGQYLQYPLRLSDDFKIPPDGEITIIKDNATTMLDVNTLGFIVFDDSYQGNNIQNGYCWMPPEFIMANFDLLQPPVFKNQSEMFDYIFNTRARVSQLTGKPLLERGSMQWHHQFLHILPKGTYKHWKLNPYNILLARPEEHDIQERYPYFLEVRQALTLEYHLKYR